jgi:DNA polymerase III delta subunit
MNFPSPILIIGDQYVSKNNILAIKKKYGEFYRIVTVSASDSSIDEIRTEAGLMDFFAQPKIIIVNDLPNQKAVREAILELASETSDNTKLVVWDSTNAIKFDPKTKSPNKTWSDFIEKFGSIKDSKVINNGAGFTDKDDDDSLELVKTAFAKYKKTISNETIKIFISIVGKDRGLLLSEIDKLGLNSPTVITNDFILDNTFPTSKEAVIYKFSNALDGNYSQAIVMLDNFLDMGMNQNLLGEIIAKKVRWQLAACYYYSVGMSWYDIDRQLMEMGKFPSYAWHNPKMSYDQKAKITQDATDTEEGFSQYKIKAIGLPLYYFGSPSTKKKKGTEEEEEVEVGEAKVEKKKKTVSLGKKEVLPMPFLATQITTALNANFVKPNNGIIDAKELRIKLFDKMLTVYLETVNKLKEIRYGEDPTQDLYEMVRIVTDRSLNVDNI